MRLFAASLIAALAACVPSPAPVGVSPPYGPPPPAPVAASANQPAAPQPAAPDPYLPEEALADATSGPLEVVGVGGFPGGRFRRASCVYRNARVFVVDETCSAGAEPTDLAVHIISPTRGHAVISAESARKITEARRADYTQFAAASSEPNPPPKHLDLAMTYEDVYAYVDFPQGSVRPFCVASIQAPKGHCSTKDSRILPGDYAAMVSHFIAEPPDSWYALVRTLNERRKIAHASVKPAQLPLQRLIAWGAAAGRDANVTVVDALLKRVGTPNLSGPIIVTSDGGAAIAGTRSSGPNNEMPAVARVDASGKTMWVKTYAKKGFVGHEDSTILEHRGALYVLTHAFPKLMLKPISRIFRLDAGGKIVWEWQGHPKAGQDRTAIPQVLRISPTPQGNLLLTGFIQVVPDGDVLSWTGELDEHGKVLREEIGAKLPDGGRDLE